MRFIRAIPREYAAEWNGATTSTVVAPMALTARPSVTKGLRFKGNTVSQPNLPRHSCGTLEAYVCVASVIG